MGLHGAVLAEKVRTCLGGKPDIKFDGFEEEEFAPSPQGRRTVRVRVKNKDLFLMQRAALRRREFPWVQWPP
jgi:hypothetical protein